MLKTKGSVLAYSLFILTMMLIIGIGVSAVSIIEKKSAGSSTSSVQAYQTADSGLQYAIKQITSTTSSTLNAAFGGCTNGVVSLNNVGAGSYQLSFFKQDGSQVTDCDTTQTSQVVNIKSVGTYKDTVRAVNVAVAASCADTPTDIRGSINSVQQNTSGKKILITASGGIGGTYDLIGYVSSTNANVNSAANVVAQEGGANTYIVDSISFMVPPNYYYYISMQAGGVKAVNYWQVCSN